VLNWRDGLPADKRPVMRNALMVGSGEPYLVRKTALSAFAADENRCYLLKK
jgi:hypothetical protein